MFDLSCLNVPLPEDVMKLEAYGDYGHALRVIDIILSRNIPKALRERLEFEKTRMEWIKREYIYTLEEAYSISRNTIMDFTMEELVKIKDQGHADWVFIDGKVKLHRRFLANIIKTYPGIKSRLIEAVDRAKNDSIDKLVDDAISEIIEKGSRKYFIHIKAGIKLAESASRIGKTVKVHIPIPSSCRQVRNIKILGSSEGMKFISLEDYPQRTAYFEKTVTGCDEFVVEYSYENHVKYIKPDYDKISPTQPDFYNEELAPHIVFTPYLKKLTDGIVGSETNQLKKVRKIYDYLTQNLKYSYVREYSTIENISEYAALNFKGDCGVQSLLFITLCRIAKIPARWQSGLNVTPLSIGCHDWAQFYVEPYGWLFADISFGGGAYRSGNLRNWDFYFGNLGPFRMPANSEFQYEFNPRKKFLRADPYDNQRGEAEYSYCGLYYDDFESIMEVMEMHEMP